MKAEYSDSLTEILAEHQGLSKNQLNRVLVKLSKSRSAKLVTVNIKQLLCLKTVIFNTDFVYSDGNKVRNLQLPVPATLQVSDNTFARCTRSNTSVLLRAALAPKQGNADILINLQDNPVSILNT